MFSLTDTQNIHNPNKIAINLPRNMYLLFDFNIHKKAVQQATLCSLHFAER